MRALIPLWGHHLLDQITSQRLHLLIPSQEMRFPHINLYGNTKYHILSPYQILAEMAKLDETHQEVVKWEEELGRKEPIFESEGVGADSK